MKHDLRIGGTIRAVISSTVFTLAATAIAASPDALFSRFQSPPKENRPWTYWFWCNSLTDRETIAAEAKDIAGLGFSGVLLCDSRGYWVDDNHVVNPPGKITWGSPEWHSLIGHAIRSCAENGISIAMNIAASGGHLRGQIDAKGDNPKHLLCRRYRPGTPFERPASPFFKDVAVFAIRTASPAAPDKWRSAGDGIVSTAASQSRRMDSRSSSGLNALEVRELNSPAEGASLGENWIILRFGSDIIPDRPEDIDVLDRSAVRRHLERVIGPLISQMPEHCGLNRTLRYLYNVSWEGMMPTWSPTFESDYERIIKRPLRPDLPILAGFDIPGRDSEAFRNDYRRSRGEMMVNNFYATVREWAHEHGMGAISESGGPWPRAPESFGMCDQLKFLAANDIPQGEFWPLREKLTTPEAGRANANGRYITRGPVYAAAAYDRPIVSMEAFTHMHRHYTVDPAFLKPVGDQAYADGANLMVWHTYSTSPKSTYGTTGNEYFAGSHINRHVTWHDDLGPFIRYLGRCQTLLQFGKPVADIAVIVNDGSYAGWGLPQNGRLRNQVASDIPVTIPRGYDFDMLNAHSVSINPNLLPRYRIVHDSRPDPKRKATVDVGTLLPDVETASSYTWRHRSDGKTHIYFLAGEGPAELTFRASAPAVEIWDAVTGSRSKADATATADGRTKVSLDLPVGGSAFVMFLPSAPSGGECVKAKSEVSRINAPWDVSFAYHKWISSEPPKARRFERLEDFTKIDDLKHFAGTATYRSSFTAAAPLPSVLSLSEIPSGLARVFINGKDCGTAWCAPWEVDVSSAVKPGRNEIEIRYTNNWHNRLVGDCALPPEKRVTKSVLHYWTTPRGKRPPCSGPAIDDKLQPSGLIGPISLKR